MIALRWEAGCFVSTTDELEKLSGRVDDYRCGEGDACRYLLYKYLYGVQYLQPTNRANQPLLLGTPQLHEQGCRCHHHASNSKRKERGSGPVGGLEGEKGGSGRASFHCFCKGGKTVTCLIICRHVDGYKYCRAYN